MRSLPKSLILVAAVATLVALLLAGCQEGSRKEHTLVLQNLQF